MGHERTQKNDLDLIKYQNVLNVKQIKLQNKNYVFQLIDD